MSNNTTDMNIISIKKVIKGHKKLIILFAVIFLIIGIYTNLIKKKVYMTNFTITSYLIQNHINETGQTYKMLSNEEFAKYINQFNELYSSRPKYMSNEINNKNFNTLKKISVSKIYDGGIDIVMYVYNINAIDSVINGLTVYLENVPYFMQIINNEKQKLVDKISIYKRQINEMDSNKKEFYLTKSNISLYNFNIYNDILESSRKLVNLENNLGTIKIVEYMKRPLIPIINETKYLVNIILYLIAGIILGIATSIVIEIKYKKGMDNK